MSLHFNPYVAHWEQLGPPLRPDASTVKAYKRLLQMLHLKGAALRVLLLGVTPELVNAPWMADADLTAIDESADMIAALWPGDGPTRRALIGDWLDLPKEPLSSNLIMGDGVLNFFSYPEEHRALAKSLAKALCLNGYLILRAFCAPDVTETPELVIRQAKNRTLKNVHEFKLKLLAALQQSDVVSGVCLGDVWEVFEAHFGTANACACETKWPLEEVKTLELYRNNPKRYHLATPTQIELALSDHFKLLHTTESASPWANRLPLMLFQKKS